MAKKYRCTVCGQIVEVEEGEPCPICGADFSLLVPVDENGNDIEEQPIIILTMNKRPVRFLELAFYYFAQ